MKNRATRNDDEIAVLFALDALSAQVGYPFKLDPIRPDEVERNAQAVDFLAHWAAGVLAIEHTQLQGFPSQVDLEVALTLHVRPALDAIAQKLPLDATFQLMFDAHAAASDLDSGIPRPKDVDTIVGRVVEAAPTLGDPPNHHHALDTRIPCSLYRWPVRTRRPRITTTIGVMPGTPLACLQEQRLRTALQKKLPKLRDAIDRHGAAETLLVLDFRSSQLCDAHGITSLLPGTAKDLPLPDHLVLVEPDTAWILRLSHTWIHPTELLTRSLPRE